MRHLIIIAAISMVSCKEEQYITRRGPEGFMREDVGISLNSIAFKSVVDFNGKVLVLDLDEKNIKELRTDGRFQWQTPTYDGSLSLGGHSVIDGNGTDVIAVEWNMGTRVNEDWQVFVLHPKRHRLYVSAGQPRFFSEDSLPTTHPEIEPNEVEHTER